MSDTPETDAQHAQFAMGGFTMDFCRKLERERDDYMQRFRIALSERDSWKMRADQKYAMRRELEELLGVDRNDASDEQFQKGLDAIKNIIAERDEAREAIIATLEQNRHLADGDDCTLAKLKSVVPEWK
jgi:hypothetical protein